MTSEATETGKERATPIGKPGPVSALVRAAVEEAPVLDVHTHLFAPEFGSLNLSGVDELLTYHYLVAETFRSAATTPKEFWRMDKKAQADLVWRSLFVESSPLSEAARGVVTVLEAFGLDTRARDLGEARAFFESAQRPLHLDRVLALSRVSGVVMTNDPFDPVEAAVWDRRVEFDRRFHAALRLDSLINDWPGATDKLAARGFRVSGGRSSETVGRIRRFLEVWIERMRPLYMAVSLPGTFTFPANDSRDWLIREAVLPTARDFDLPLALMIGVRRAVNPALGAAGDGVQKADSVSVERICAEHHDVRFLVTFLSRENQHELCVAARKFSNLMPFGCWWFLNSPSIVAEITRQRLELLGPTFIPQHSDARVLEQLIYKWRHSRRIIAECLTESYTGLVERGRGVTQAEIERDVNRLFSGNFKAWVGLSKDDS